MWAIRGALAIVGAVALLLAGVGLFIGLTTDVTGGVSGRPFIYWLIALTNLAVAWFVWPLLLSFFVQVDLPSRLRTFMERTPGPKGLAQFLPGRPVVAQGRSTDSKGRLGLALRVLVEGAACALLSLPLPVLSGVAGTRVGRLELWEAIPLALAFWLPLVWTVRLARRSRPQPSVDS